MSNQRQQHPGNACWRSKATRALSLPPREEVVHDFSSYDTHVYPIDLYPALRAHLRREAYTSRDDGGGDRGGDAEGHSLTDVMSAGACDDDDSVVGEGQVEIGRRRRFRREMQFNLMATFMW